MKVNRWTIGRRAVQLAVLTLLASPAFGWTLFEGTLDAASLGGILLSDPLATLQVLLLTGSLATPLLIGCLTVLALYGLLGGRVFCGWVCPVGFLTDLVEPLARRLRRPVWALNWKLVSLVVMLGLTLLLGLPAFETLSPIGIGVRALTFGAGGGLVLLILILLVELLLVRRAWCRSLCPLGGLYSLLGRLSPVRVRYHADRCTHCGACSRVCFVEEVLEPSLERGLGQIRDGDCSRCGACVGVCPVQALDFTVCQPFTTRRIS